MRPGGAAVREHGKVLRLVHDRRDDGGSDDPEEKCSEGSLGEKCEITVHLLAQACAGGTSGAGTVPPVRGIHPSDRDKAYRSAWDKVTPQLIEAAVKDALKSAIQIGE